MKLAKILFIVAIIGLLFAGCKKGEVDIKFNHNLHVVENEVECSQCHKMDDDGKMSNPSMDACKECHDIDEDNPSEDCLDCHSVKSAKNDYEVEETGVEIPESYKDISFTHDPHSDYECSKCHEGIDKVEDLHKIKFPDMDLCMQCHNGDTAPKSCDTCHTKIRKNKAPESHSGDWASHHGFESKFDKSCEYCHGKKKDFCQKCHRTQKPKDHIFNWKSTQHGIEATHDRKLCATCHTASYCSNCHKTEKPISHRRGDWTKFSTKPAHAEEAEKNFRSCNVCHTTSECLKCHKTMFLHQMK